MSNTVKLEPLYTYQEAASYLRVSKSTVRRYVREGYLQATRWMGGQPRIKESELTRFRDGASRE